MNDDIMGANEIDFDELEELFRDDTQQTTPTATEDTTDVQDGNNETVTENSNKSNNVDNTKAFAKRLRESTDKAVKEERENIAKQFGYNSYDEMLNARRNQLYEDKGLDPEEINPIVETLVNQRFEADPRFKELENYRKQQATEFAKRELAVITELTGGQITKLSQLSKAVIDKWKENGSLKSAYLEVEGENEIMKLRSNNSKGTTTHMQNVGSSGSVDNSKRNLTAEEKRMWKFFNPKMTDEELNKKTVNT